MKRASIVALVLGILILLASVVLPVISVITSVSATANQGSGIIGGAGAPTFALLFSQAVKGLPTVLMLVGLTVTTASIVFLCTAKKKEN